MMYLRLTYLTIYFMLSTVSVLTNALVSHFNNMRCYNCIHCLPQPNKDKFLNTTTFVFQTRKCPENHSLEYSYFEQILYLYRPPVSYNIPCRSECVLCKKEINNRCPQIQMRQKSPWEETYSGIFYQNASQYALSSQSYEADCPKTTQNPVQGLQAAAVMTNSPNNNAMPASLSFNMFKGKGKRSVSQCEVSRRIIAYNGSKRVCDEMWHAVWFNSTDGQGSCQFFEEIICSPQCSLKYTERSFLYTTLEARGQYGHGFALMNHEFCANIKFFTDRVPSCCMPVNT